MRVYHSSCLPIDFTGLTKVVYIDQTLHDKDFIGNYTFISRETIGGTAINTVAVFIVKPKQSKS